MVFNGLANGWASEREGRNIDIMFQKFKTKIQTILWSCTAWMAVIVSYTPVLADEGDGGGSTGGLTIHDATDVSNKVVTTLNDILVPIGGLVIFITVVIAAFKIITTAHKPNERAEALTSLPFIVGGGLLLGGALLASGLIYGLMQTIHT